MRYILGDKLPVSAYDLRDRYNKSYDNKLFDEGLNEVHKYTSFISLDTETKPDQLKLAYLYGLHHTLEKANKK